MLPKSVIILIFTLFIVLPTTYFVVKHLKSQQSQSQNQNQSEPTQSPTHKPTQPPVKCGNCKSGEDCIYLSNLNPDTWSNLTWKYKNEIAGMDVANNSLSFCYNPSTLSNKNIKNSLPSSIENNQLYYDFSKKGGTSDDAYDKPMYCIPTSVDSTDTNCFSSFPNCPSGCKWVTLPDDYDGIGGLVDTQVKNYMNYTNGNVNQGYYCDNGKILPGKVVQYTGLSTWKDCINQITNQGTIDAHWDDTNKICNTLQIPDYSNPTPPSSWSINSFQPTQLIQCSGANSPCPNCKSNDDFVSAIKCSGTDTPCTNCKQTGDYICDTCQPPTNTNGWNFTTCAPNDSNGNAVQVLGPKDSNGNGGNCPWGCSSISNSNNCYNTDIPSGSKNVFGQPLSNTGSLVCMQDGIVRPETN